MPDNAPKGILLHGGPPSDFRLRLDEGVKTFSTHGASETYTVTRRCATTKVHHLYELQPDKVRHTVPQGVVSKGPRSEGRKDEKGAVQEACPHSPKERFNYR